MAFQPGPLHNASMANLRIEPIIKQTKSEIKERLNEQVRIKRDLQKLGLDNPSLLPKNSQLNTTTNGMLNVFKAIQEEIIEEENERDDLQRLLSVGSISIFEDADMIKRPLVTLDTAEYKMKRNKIELELVGATRFETFKHPKELPDSTNSLLSIITNRNSETKLDNNNPKKAGIDSLAVSNNPASKNVPDLVSIANGSASTDTVTSANTVNNPTVNRSAGSTSTINRPATPINYPSQMIPISATPQQIQECDFVTRSTRGSETEPDLALRKLIDSLSCAFVDFSSSPEDVHEVSGKLVFISQFLSALKNEDLTIAIVTKDLNEESNVFYLINDKIKLCCTRLGNVVDDGWNGEYGVIVKTKKFDEPIRLNASMFSCMADLTLCMSITIDDSLPIFSSIKKNEKEPAPVVWLITAGSFEETAFRFMKKEGRTFSQCQHDLLEFVCHDNRWPKETDRLNKESISHLAAWVQSRNNAVYQYGSMLQSIVPTAPVAQELAPEASAVDTASDMEIDSDNETEQVDESTNKKAALSSALSEYITKLVFPISTVMTPTANNESQQLSPHELDIVKAIASSKGQGYLQEVDKLRIEFEEKQKEIQMKYINETKKEYF